MCVDLVVDANILFAALIKNGETAHLFFEKTLHFYAPDFLLEEFQKYKDYLVQKTHRDEGDFYKFLEILKRKVIFTPQSEIEVFIPDAKIICPDIGDIPYFALALKLGANIWSNEKRLKKQAKIQIYSTEELIGWTSRVKPKPKVTEENREA